MLGAPFWGELSPGGQVHPHPLQWGPSPVLLPPPLVRKPPPCPRGGEAPVNWLFEADPLLPSASCGRTAPQSAGFSTKVTAQRGEGHERARGWGLRTPPRRCPGPAAGRGAEPTQFGVPSKAPLRAQRDGAAPQRQRVLFGDDPTKNGGCRGVLAPLVLVQPHRLGACRDRGLPCEAAAPRAGAVPLEAGTLPLPALPGGGPPRPVSPALKGEK